MIQIVGSLGIMGDNTCQAPIILIETILIALPVGVSSFMRILGLHGHILIHVNIENNSDSRFAGGWQVFSEAQNNIL